MDKAAAKAVFAASGLPVARGRVVRHGRTGAVDPMPLPYVVKPVNEGSSVGVEIIRTGDNRRAEMAAQLALRPRAMVGGIHPRPRTHGRRDGRPRAGA